MPAEWEPHEATWLSWPKDPLTFPPGIIEKVEALYCSMVEALRKGERIEILVDSAAEERRVADLLASTEDVRFQIIRTADVWMRDYGPIFIRGGDVAATKWRFNAWGDKYEELKPDDLAGARIAERSGLRTFQTGIVLEGGSIDVNGKGTCLTTEQCLLNPNRDPERSKAEAETFLRDFLGATNVVWLRRGIDGDDTDGHVDDIARFVNTSTIVAMEETDRRDKNHAPLSENLERLNSAEDQDGRPLNIVRIPMPRKKVGGAERLPASYANFYIGNRTVLVPTFGDRNDDHALDLLEEAFPGRDVVGLNCEALVYGFGGIHCVTQQQPSP